MKTLYIFTNYYPYSHQENFLEDEILYLSKRFETIKIISFDNKGGYIRSIPDNCIVENIPISKNKWKYNLYGMFHYKTVGIIIKEFFRNQVYKSKTRLRAWISSVRYINNCLNNKDLQSILRNVKKDDVCYFYWGIGQCLLSIYLKGKCKTISRFHGEWDLWEESYGGFHSLRTEVASSLNKAVFISKKGENYFKERYPNTMTAVYPLGSKDCGIQLDKPNDDIIRVVSCSTVYPLKRVPLIYEALNNLTELNIEWTHLGGGSHFEELKDIIKKSKKEHLKINLPGMMTHDEVLDYYKTHHFDIFINMSTSEGVPVSIMEAMSFGIPILATDVGSTSEEVTAQVGELLSPNPSIEEITSTIHKLLNSNYTPREFWITHYNADKNYEDFTNLIYNL